MSKGKVAATIIATSTFFFMACINLSYIYNQQIVLGSSQYDSINASTVIPTEIQVELKEVEQPHFIRNLNGSFNNKVISPYWLSPNPPQVIQEDLPSEMTMESDLNLTENKTLKKILFWNEWFGVKDFNLGYGRKPFLIGNCRYNNCFTTGQKDRFTPSEIDAIFWHLRADDKSLPKTRYPNAQYIFFMLESASHTFTNVNDFNNTFDLSFTYRLDSDIPYPYSKIAQRDSIEYSYITHDFSKGKTKIAAWFVSNCGSIPSGRNLLAAGLMKYTEVDIYGGCGPLKCGREKDKECHEMAAKKYFFYLAFENSLCKDYVTEKFFNTLNYDFVPVVYGSGLYWKHAPPHSYIDVFDFPSIEDLAKYLIHLSKAPYEYNEYFRWKANYFVLPGYTHKIIPLCKMCEILNTKKPSNKLRYDIQEWFVHQSDCKNSKSPFISEFLSGKKLNMSYNQFKCQDNPKNCFE